MKGSWECNREKDITGNAMGWCACNLASTGQMMVSKVRASAGGSGELCQTTFMGTHSQKFNIQAAETLLHSNVQEWPSLLLFHLATLFAVFGSGQRQTVVFVSRICLCGQILVQNSCWVPDSLDFSSLVLQTLSFYVPQSSHCGT